MFATSAAGLWLLIMGLVKNIILETLQIPFHPWLPPAVYPTPLPIQSGAVQTPLLQCTPSPLPRWGIAGKLREKDGAVTGKPQPSVSLLISATLTKWWNTVRCSFSFTRRRNSGFKIWTAVLRMYQVSAGESPPLQCKVFFKKKSLTWLSNRQHFWRSLLIYDVTNPNRPSTWEL